MREMQNKGVDEMSFVTVDRKTGYLMPPSMDDWLNEDHLARFVVEIVDGLDLSKLSGQYAGRGVKAHHPSTLLALLVYGYATGVFSSRKIERATYDSVAFRYIAAGTHPDHDTIAHFRRRFLSEIEGLFVQVLAMASEMKLLKLGRVCLDGTKIHANASRHSALSYGHIEKLEAQLKKEVRELLSLGEKADQEKIPDGMSLPEELKRREDRLELMRQAKEKLAVRAHERYVREQAEYEANMAARAAKEQERGKPLCGKKPEEPKEKIRAKDQINLTDEQSRIMPVSGGGFEQCYNAQASVDADTMLVVCTGVTQAVNDKQQVEPMLETLAAQSITGNNVTCLIADAGYFSAQNVASCVEKKIEPLIAGAREHHHLSWSERHSEPAPLPVEVTPVQAMAHRLRTKEGRAIYALRKQTVEPVFGIIKSVMGFRQFLLRGLTQVRGEWNLVCLAWNLKRLAVLRQKFR